jgi:hypothetical protein
MAVKTDHRGNARVIFERGIAAQMMGIDGTWRRDCTMEDVSEVNGDQIGVNFLKVGDKKKKARSTAVGA